MVTTSLAGEGRNARNQGGIMAGLSGRAGLFDLARTPLHHYDSVSAVRKAQAIREPVGVRITRMSLR
jgi:hypothetical protein